MTESPPLPDQPDGEAAEQQMSPYERVAQSMGNIGQLVEGTFVTDANRMAFSTEIEVHIDAHGRVAFPGGPKYADGSSNIISYHAYRFASGEGREPATEAVVKLHTPRTSFADYEYTYDLQANRVSVQRGSDDDAPHEPRRDEDARYVETMEASLRNGIEQFQAMFGAADTEDETAGLITYNDQLTGGEPGAPDAEA